MCKTLKTYKIAQDDCEINISSFMPHSFISVGKTLFTNIYLSLEIHYKKVFVKYSFSFKCINMIRIIKLKTLMCNSLYSLIIKQIQWNLKTFTLSCLTINSTSM